MEPREWVNKHIKELRNKFIGKTVIVSENKVIKTFDGPVNPLKINEVARKICKEKWCYIYLPASEEEYLL